MEVRRLVEICQALQTKKLSQGVDFNIVNPFWKDTKQKIGGLFS